MKKTKTIVCGIGAILALLAVLSFFVSLFPVLPTVETPAQYAITYKAVTDGMISDIYEDMWEENGNYPDSYVQGENMEIDDLKSFVPITASMDYDFNGWYFDPQLTVEFDGNFDNVRGDVTLYAKISKAFWTGFY